MYKDRKVTAIIAAAGQARRMQGTDKIFMDLGGRPALARLLDTFEKNDSVDSIVAAVRKERIGLCRDMAEKYGFRKLTAVISGESERPCTVRKALLAMPEDTDIVLVQDGARPFTSSVLIDRVLEAVVKHGAAVPAVKVRDTIKEVREHDGYLTVNSTPDRSRLRAVQTPQGFTADLIFRAYGMDPAAGRDEAGPEDFPDLGRVTDDASLVENMGHAVAVVDGDEDNIKITTPEDLEKADMIRKHSTSAIDDKKAFPRTGTGFDVHAFAAGRRLVIGGVDIPHELGLAGHSDADVLIHAVMDALLGACAMRDIGYYFPDTSDEFKDADSMKMLARVGEMLREGGWKIINVDSTVIAQKPKLAAHIDDMRRNMAQALELPAEAVGVKATTTEKLGFTGRGEGIAAQAAASVIKIN